MRGVTAKNSELITLSPALMSPIVPGLFHSKPANAAQDATMTQPVTTSTILVCSEYADGRKRALRISHHTKKPRPPSTMSAVTVSRKSGSDA